MACKHCEIDSRKYCPQCGTILESAQNSARLCDNCGWFGDYTKAKDRPPGKPLNIDFIKHCPQCNTVLRPAKNPMCTCDNCGWSGDCTKALSVKKDTPDKPEPCPIAPETFNSFTFAELGLRLSSLMASILPHTDPLQVTANLDYAQNCLDIMQAKLDDIKKNL